MRKRRAVVHLQQHGPVSQRRACQTVDQPRATQRYQGRKPAADGPLVARLRELALRHPRYGYRRITALVRAEGWQVNRKRVQRLWRTAGLKVPGKQRKRRRLGWAGNTAVRRRAQRPNQVWSYDFVWDQTADGRRLKWLPVVDEYTRECLTLPVARSLTGADVVAELRRLVAERGAPEYLRSDNGPEFVAREVREWLEQERIGTLYIEPGSPWENAYSESFNSRLRDEFLDREAFDTVLEAKVLAAAYRQEYNERRPHSALGYRTPVEFAAACRREKFSLPLGGGKWKQQRQQQQPKTLIQVGT
jgi:putative transposase